MTQIKTCIPFPPYSYRMYIIFTDDLEATAEELVKKKLLAVNHGVDETTGGFTVRFKNQNYVYIILKYDASVNDIAHESYHALCSMFKWIGAVHEEEVFAYHMGYLVRLICDDQENAQKKLKKPLTKRKK